MTNAIPYLQFSEVERISRPVHLGKEILIKHFAQELEKVDLHLVEGLILQEFKQFTFPLFVVEAGEEISKDGRHFAAASATGASV